VGFATFWIHAERRIGEIANNAVDPDFQGRGLAQQMYRAVLERFRREGLLYAKVQTGLDEAHAPARRAYERAGFDIRHETVTYYQKL
jgi:ribosomal protein S18 acetylase RimI-like enzyme